MFVKHTEKKYTIGISCVGSGIGQSVINSLRLSRLPITTIGFGTNPFGYGAYDCDAYDYTPIIYSTDYIDKLISKCQEYKVDLLIPGLDDETLFIARNIDKFDSAGIKTICSKESLIAVCREKERLGIEFNPIPDVFVKCYDQATLEEGLSSGKIHFPLIAKPRGGFASREINIINSREELAKVSKDHIIQELLLPRKDDPNYDIYMRAISQNRNLQVSEISIQLVYTPEGELMGRMASYNKLLNGVPIEILPFENEEVWTVIDRLTPALLRLGLKGPLNIQGRMTEQGLKLFEMNPRFTGITGLRALMGFNEVEACVKEWLEIDKGKNIIRINHNRFGIRQTADKSIPIERNDRVLSLYKKINGSVIVQKKTLFITGSSGNLGRNLIFELIKTRSESYEIWAFDLDKRKIEQLFGGQIQCCFDQDDLEKGRVPLGNIDILFHFGSTTHYSSNSETTNDLEFSNELFTRAVSNQVPAILNISSQSIYGQVIEPRWNEQTPISPDSFYAQEKYAIELLLQSLKRINNQLFSSSLRLGAVVGNDFDFLKDDIFPKIVKQAYKGKRICISNGSWEFDFIDIKDAISAFIAMIDTNPRTWKPIYNLGSSRIYGLAYVAEKAVEHAARHNGGKHSEIIVDNENALPKVGMDCSLFINDIGWKPKFDLEDTIESLIKLYKTNPKEKRR